MLVGVVVYDNVVYVIEVDAGVVDDAGVSVIVVVDDDVVGGGVR